jgi:cyclopropane fatty-acyl-phospholipid synthase-like methyltransferase
VTRPPLPARARFALSLLDVEPTHRVLEFGCGNADVARAVAALLTTGSVVAIDRSAIAVTRARAGGDDLDIRQEELADVTTDEPFDRILGINVNAFWTGDAVAECDALRRLLADGGLVVVAYETPAAVRPEMTDRVVVNLERHGFAATVVPGDAPSLVAIRATIAGHSTR